MARGWAIDDACGEHVYVYNIIPESDPLSDGKLSYIVYNNYEYYTNEKH